MVLAPATRGRDVVLIDYQRDLELHWVYGSSAKVCRIGEDVVNKSQAFFFFPSPPCDTPSVLFDVSREWCLFSE